MNSNKKSVKTIIILAIIGFIIFTILLANKNNTVENSGIANSEIVDSEKVEIPAKIQDRAEQIISHLGYTVSYNSDWKIPNWVAYELTKEEVEGVIPRGNHFIPDPKVSENETATIYDYKNSGWDRGHMAPAADMKWSEQAMKESFYLSNICPQNNNLNSGIWKDLEEQVRGLATENGNLYIVCGPIVSKQPNTIGDSKVAIPDAFYKVLLRKDNNDWTAIAFMFANESGRKLLSTYAMSVDEIEIITGIDFFPTLPDDIENIIESEVDFSKWTNNYYE